MRFGFLSQKKGYPHPSAPLTEFYSHKGFPGGSPAMRETRVHSIPGSGRSPGERNGYALQCPRLESPTDGGAWRAMVHGVTQSQTQLSTQGKVC